MGKLRLKDKVAIITGGSSGIGLGIAKKLFKKGASIAIISRDNEKLTKAKQLIEAIHFESEYKPKVFIYSGDIGKYEDIKNFITTVAEKFSRIDILVANSAVLIEKSISETTEADFDEMMNVNFKGAYFTTQLSLPWMVGGGDILLVSSIAGNLMHGMSNSSVYAASKLALKQLARSITTEYSEKNIRANVIEPGFIDTPMFDRFLVADPLFKEKRGFDIPAGKLGTPEEVAELAYFLVSGKANYIMGSDIIIDGGVSAVYTVSNSGANKISSNSRLLFSQTKSRNSPTDIATDDQDKTLQLKIKAKL